MIENMETLLVLSKTGTMLEASTELRISQSAVSKRIAVLEKYYGRELTQKKGRRVELTQHGQHLVDKISPVLSELRDVFVEDQMASGGELTIGVSDAILSSWGARAFYSIKRKMADTKFVFHAHRTPVVLDRIRSGEFIAGVCTGSDEFDKDLQSEVLMHEEMVIIPSRLGPLKYPWEGQLPVITIESYSGAWRAFHREVEQLEIRRVVALESFFSVAQMAVAGFGHGMVPIGVARTLKIPARKLGFLGEHGLSRPVRFVARKSTYSIPLVQTFFSLAQELLAER